MLLTKLPLELVHEVIAIAVVSAETSSDALRLREVNRKYNTLLAAISDNDSLTDSRLVR